MGATSVVRKEGRYSGVICRGDLALGKIPTFKLLLCLVDIETVGDGILCVGMVANTTSYRSEK